MEQHLPKRYAIMRVNSKITIATKISSEGVNLDKQAFNAS